MMSECITRYIFNLINCNIYRKMEHLCIDALVCYCICKLLDWCFNALVYLWICALMHQCIREHRIILGEENIIALRISFVRWCINTLLHWFIDEMFHNVLVQTWEFWLWPKAVNFKISARHARHKIVHFIQFV